MTKWMLIAGLIGLLAGAILADLSERDALDNTVGQEDII